MRFFLQFACIGAVASATLTLNAAYGSSVLPVPTPMTALWHGGAVTEDFKAVRQAAKCSFPIDLVVVQQATSTFSDDFPNMPSQLKTIAEYLESSHPNSRVALRSFADKPFPPYGVEGDECVTDVQKDFVKASDAVSKLQKFYSTTPNGGGDERQNNLQALSVSAKSDWAKNATRILVHVTDSKPHFRAEVADVEAIGFSKDGETDCRGDFYPAADTVAKQLHKAGIYTVHLVNDRYFMSGDVAHEWSLFNQMNEQTKNMVNLLASDSSDFAEKLISLFKAVEQVECTPAPARRLQVVETTEPGCSTKIIKKDGVYVNVGFPASDEELKITIEETA